MLRNKRIIQFAKPALCIMLSFLCIFSLVACNLGTDDGEETESTPISEAESEIQTLAKTSPYVIIVSKNASDTVHASAAQLQGVIKSLLGYDLKIKDDYLSWSDTASEHEILIGDVSRDEAKKITGLRVDDFSVSTSAKKWIIKGGNEQSSHREFDPGCGKVREHMQSRRLLSAARIFRNMLWYIPTMRLFVKSMLLAYR